MHDALHIWLLGGPPEGSERLFTALQKTFVDQTLVARGHSNPVLPDQWGTPGLVLVWGQQQFDDHDQAMAHAQLRSRLQAADVAYQVIYPHSADGGTSHLHHALRAVRSAIKPPTQRPERPAHPPASRWLAGCEKCSDPVCEHRLFTDLLKQD